MAMTRQEQIKKLESEWADSPRWNGVSRSYSAEDVVKLRGTVQVEHTLARLGAEKFWRLVNQDDPEEGQPEAGRKTEATKDEGEDGDREVESNRDAAPASDEVVGE